MSTLTVDTIKTPEGYDFLRSDGLHFFLATTKDGRAVLHFGRRWKAPPAAALIGFEATAWGKLDAARQFILEYRT